MLACNFSCLASGMNLGEEFGAGDVTATCIRVEFCHFFSGNARVWGDGRITERMMISLRRLLGYE